MGERPKTSIVKAPEIEMNPLPSHLKYVFLGENETLPVRLLEVLKENREAIGWSVDDIKGISPTTCMHNIYLKEGAKPVRQPKRRLNSPMMEVVKKEVLQILRLG